MSYSPPSVSNIDFSGLAGGYSVPSVSSIDLTGTSAPSDPEGVIGASLSFSAALDGAASAEGQLSAVLSFNATFDGSHHTGDLVAGFGFDTSFTGIVGSQSTLAAAVGFSAEFQGETAGLFGSVDAGLGFSASFRGFQDWTAQLPSTRLQEFYTLTITGSPDLNFKISSWQATMNQGGRSNYLQAVIPAAANVISEISARSEGELVISKGFRFADGSERAEEILRSRFDTFRYDRGPRNFTVTVSGYAPSDPAQKNTRTLSGVRSLSVTDGKFRARCDIDMFLRPGMTVVALQESFEINYINFFVSDNDKFCEVSQR